MDLSAWWPAQLEDHPRVRDRLLTAYDDPARGYHDRRHLAEVFARLDELMPTDDPRRDTVLLAAWFHDAVHEGARDDEERSAALAEVELAGTGLREELVAEVARLVRMTEHHRPEPDDLAGALLSDADLAILAATPTRYAEYVTGVRLEYAELPDEVFRGGRLAVLEDLAAKPSLFHSERARELWEAAARENLSSEIRSLAAAS